MEEAPQHPHPRQQLAEAGINLWASFRIDSLPELIRERIVSSHPGAERAATAVLLGSYGGYYWRKISAVQREEAHPVDSYVIAQIERAFAASRHRILYPGDHMLPLTELGRLAGWHHESPLGLGIHPVHGLWYAYRAVVLVWAFEPEATLPQPTEHPCTTCEDQPCVTACPAGAVSPGGFDVNSCVEFRLEEGSPCADRCLARLACPVGRSARYEQDQMSYHYGYSLRAIRRYRGLE